MNKSTPRHIIIKLMKTKTKEKILKVAREKQCIKYRETSIRISMDFSPETMKAKKP